MNKIFKFKPQSPEWLNARRQCVTATEVASLFGLNKHKGVKQLVKDKMYSTLINGPFLRLGRIMESAVLAAFHEDLAINAKPMDAEYVVFARLNDVKVAATPDGKFEHDGLKGLIECKTTQPHKFVEWETNIPSHYLLQVHTQLLCMNESIALIGCLEMGMPFSFIVWSVERDLEIDYLIKHEVNRFWECFDNKEDFAVNKDLKADMVRLMENSIHRVY